MPVSEAETENDRLLTSLIKGLALLSVLLALGLFVWFAVGPMTFNYDAEFDFVQRQLGRPGAVTIVDSWRHEDITLEDFGFVVRTAEGRVFELSFRGARKLATFDAVDGIEFRRKGKRVWTIDLNAPGAPIQIRDMDEFLSRADEVLAAFEERPAGQRSATRMPGNLIRLEVEPR